MSFSIFQPTYRQHPQDVTLEIHLCNVVFTGRFCTQVNLEKVCTSTADLTNKITSCLFATGNLRILNADCCERWLPRMIATIIYTYMLNHFFFKFSEWISISEFAGILLFPRTSVRLMLISLAHVSDRLLYICSCL